MALPPPVVPPLVVAQPSNLGLGQSESVIPELDELELEELDELELEELDELEELLEELDELEELLEELDELELEELDELELEEFAGGAVEPLPPQADRVATSKLSAVIFGKSFTACFKNVFIK